MAEPVELTVTIEPSPGERRDLTITAAPDASTAAVLAELQQVIPLTGPLLLDGQPLAGGAAWSASGVRHGSVLRSYETPPPDVPSTLELRVVAGPSAGAVRPMPVEGATIGRATGCTLQVDDDEVSRVHAEVSYDSYGTIAVRDLGSTNGLAVDRVMVRTSASGVPAGAVLTLGETRVSVQPRRTDAAAMSTSGDGTVVLNRPPRRRPPEDPPIEVTLPAEPRAPERTRLPLTTLLVPLILGAVLFLTMPSSPQYLLLMAMSPLMVAGNAIADRRGGRRRHRTAVREHGAALRAARAAIEQACAHERIARLEAAPDPAELGGRATLPSSRLWERRTGDSDACHLRLGLGDLPASVRLVPPPGQAAEAVPTLTEVPVVVPLDEAAVLGVAGPREAASALIRWLSLQAALLQGPEDLRVVVLTTAEQTVGWEWLRWLPHAAGSGGCRVLVGTDEATCAARVAELLQRREVRSGGIPHPRVLLVVDGAQRLRRVPGLPELLAHAAAVGVMAICRDDQERLLPQECGAVAVFSPGSRTRLTLRHRDGRVVTDVLADQVSLGWADEVARALGRLSGGAPEAGAGPVLPSSTRLLDLLDLERPSADAVADSWLRAGRTTQALMGWGLDGPLAIDLAADGPHALVAGTTGSGKSELLQTLVASLAAGNRPDALTFVLVDYKGGAAFRDCARLPHTVGMVTDLDGRLTERALSSLTAELRHRERVLAEHGVKDLEQLWARTQGSPPLARLVIVIDEFATLVEELPDFVRGLVGIAQRGRSLGIHLVLATQRPGGVVSPDIRANTNLRICLRVTQAGESSDVIDASVAGDIQAGLPGRGYLRTGAGALQPFQAARVGAAATANEDTTAAPRVECIAFSALGQRPALTEASTPADGPTDLSLLVDAICAADKALDLPAPRRPWLDPLPDLLALDDLAEAPPTEPPGPAVGLAAAEPDLLLGLVDVPARQQRLPYQLHVAATGHLLVVGAPRSGRSAVLHTVAASAARAWSADDVHLYALDFGNQALAPLAGLPHCGAVVGRDQPERLERLLARLQAEVERRQSVLAASGFADLAEQRRLAPPAERLPWLLLLVDRWEGLVQAYQEVDLGRRIDELLQLLREGSSVGLRAVVTADRSGLLGRLPSMMPDKLVLRMADRADYALADIPAKDTPASLPPGRGLVLAAGASRAVHEVQIALLARDPDGPAQQDALRRLVTDAVQRHAARPQRHRPLRVDALPGSVTVADTLALGPLAAEASGVWALLGVGGDQLQPIGVDLAEDGPGFLVAGPPRSGRSTALLVMAESLLRGGRRLCLVSPMRSPLQALVGHPGVTGCLDPDTTQDEAQRALAAAGGRPVVVVDDAERLTDSAVGAVLEAELRSREGAYVLAAGNNEDLQTTYRGFTLEVRRSRCGLLLNPQSTLDGDLVGARLARSTGGGRHPGRALLAVRGEITSVQVALPARRGEPAEPTRSR